MDELPPQLRNMDRHPLTPLAAKVITDLAKVGIPAHVVDNSDDRSHVHCGVVLHLYSCPSDPSGQELLLRWYVPDEDGYRGEGARERLEVMGAAATLTAAVVSVLTAFGHRVRTAYEEPNLPYPFIYVQFMDETP
ncbi:hypothetical protein GPA10_11250 [Streptomyces sp. p1417]|uniref:Uncharacterized protein n=1 Tax=Streptomyces typhae TaxID=2681492 RepID=A0A6L6WTD8_9ACTN|nr:hypothetical protein [Streptomyces typhae]MVO85313.1 hypothetical protein [Streptomyces typhae]